jgi:hypothetical protein
MTVQDSDDLESESFWFNYVGLELYLYSSRMVDVSICISLLDNETVDWTVLI